jgi:membrane-associated phospholipid phosphatase
MLAVLVLWGIALAVCWRFDRDLFHATYVGRERLPAIEAFDWYRLFRVCGYLPAWLAIGGALLLHQRPWRSASFRPGQWAGALIIVAAALAGGIAEALRPLVGRLRPFQTDGVHRYHGLPDDPAMSASFGGASSHVAVAFGAACMLAFLWPRAGIVALIMATGCAWTRVISGAHFASDAVAGALIGYACARVLPHKGGGERHA